MIGKFTKASLALAVLAASASSVYAAPTFSTGMLGTTTVTFTAPLNINNKITAKTNFTSGLIPKSTIVGQDDITVKDQSTQLIGVEWDTGLMGKVPGDTDATSNVALAKGKNASNTFVVKLDGGTNSLTQVPGTRFWGVGTATSSLSLPLLLPSDQTIAADTYTLATFAATYTN